MNTISGKTEFDIFRNYYTAEKREQVQNVVNTLPLQAKDDVAVGRLRELAKQEFHAKNYYVCLERYTECLRYATWKGPEFAMALCNRSATYFAMNNFKHCLNDINLSLQADIPINLKPKMLIRKAKCFAKLGCASDMIETIEDCRKQIQDYLDLPSTDKDYYMAEIQNVMETRLIDINELPFEGTSSAIELISDKNPLNPNISASIQMKYNRITGTDFLAARDIERGEVLVVDQAYATGCIQVFNTQKFPDGIFFCDYCWNEAKNCIPCNICVNLLYCSENCRINSWTDHHQWECDMFRANRFDGEVRLALRSVIKAASSGVIFQITRDTRPFKLSKDLDPYLYIYSLHLNLASIRSKYTDKFVRLCEKTVFMIEFLKKTNFFTHVMSTSTCQKDYPALVHLFGGLLLRHNVQMYSRLLTANLTSSSVTLNETQNELELLFVKSMRYYAFCPLVSGFEYSCKSNTSLYFNGTTCIVKACKNIKAGNRIFRSGFNLTPAVPLLKRKEFFNLDDLLMDCNCTACQDINKNMEILDTFLCSSCGSFGVLHIFSTPSMICKNCHYVTNLTAIQSMMESAPTYFNLTQTLFVDPDLEIIALAKTLQKIVNPYHKFLHDAYKALLFVSSKLGGIDEFKMALQNFKVCSKKRNGMFDVYEYVMDLTVIWKACFMYLQMNKTKLQKQEIMEMLNYFADVVQEAKEIAEYTFPPLLRLFPPVELFILKFRLTHMCLED